MNVQDSLIASCKNCLDSRNIHSTLDITYKIYQQQQEEDTDQGNEWQPLRENWSLNTYIVHQLKDLQLCNKLSNSRYWFSCMKEKQFNTSETT